MQLHPSEISPAELFDLFYFIRNPLDNTTYYVRAVIYDLKTGAVLATQNLTQTATNPRLFVATLQAPGDQGSIGRNIVAIASVYTDSGYTTKSDAYEEQEQYFLIRSPISIYPSGGGGGVDYTALREIVADELKKQKFLKLTDLPFDSLFGAIGTLQREINRIPKDMVDLAPVRRAIADVRQAVADIPQPEPVDIQPVINEVRAIPGPLLKAIHAIPVPLLAKITDVSENLKRTGTAIIDGIQQTFTKAASEVVTKTGQALDRELAQKKITLSIGDVAEKSKEPTPSPIAIDHLMS